MIIEYENGIMYVIHVSDHRDTFDLEAMELLREQCRHEYDAIGSLLNEIDSYIVHIGLSLAN